MRLIILGSGGYGRVVADVASQLNQYDSIFFLDDHDRREDVMGKCSDYVKFIDNSTAVYPAFGNNKLRLRWIETLVGKGANVPVIAHSTAYISPTASVGAGTVVLPNAIINSYTMIEIGCIINLGAIIDHNCIVEKGSHICLGVIIKADNHIPDCTKIEAGTVIENKTYH